MDQINRERFGPSANIRASLIVFAIALVLMAMFLSSSLQSYAYDLPVNATTERIVHAADTWHGWMVTLGTAGIAEAIAVAVADLHEVGFGS